MAGVAVGTVAAPLRDEIRELEMERRLSMVTGGKEVRGGEGGGGGGRGRERMREGSGNWGDAEGIGRGGGGRETVDRVKRL